MKALRDFLVSNVLLVSAAIVGVIVAVLIACHVPEPTPPPQVVQQAAGLAAAAIVQTEHADTALKQHHVTIVKDGTLKSKQQVLIAKADTQEHHLIVLADSILPPRDSLPPPVVAYVDSSRALVATLREVISVQAVRIDSLTADNQQLATTLLSTRTELAKHQTVVIPQAKAHVTFVSAVRKLVGGSVGYGVYAGQENNKIVVHTGPWVAAGVRIAF